MRRLAGWRAAAAAAAVVAAAAGVAVAAKAISDGLTEPAPDGLAKSPLGPDPVSDAGAASTRPPLDDPLGPDPVSDAGAASTRPPLDDPPDPDPVSDAGPASTRPPLDNPPDPGPVPDDHGLSEGDLAAAVASSVRVAAPACRGIVREGSGFAAGDGDLVVTIAHLMVGMEAPEVELADGRRLAAVAVAFDPVNDLAVLRVPGAGLRPLPLSEAAPDGTLGAVLAWEEEGVPDPTPFRIDRPVTVRTEPVGTGERIERPSWLLAADTEVGDSGAALVAELDGRITAVGVAWGASRRGAGGVAYATRAGAVERLLEGSDLSQPAVLPGCG